MRTIENVHILHHQQPRMTSKFTEKVRPDGSHSHHRGPECFPPRTGMGKTVDLACSCDSDEILGKAVPHHLVLTNGSEGKI
eukprot:scaffold5357_cov208-Amphora_coffeaeformis.AAC.14